MTELTSAPTGAPVATNDILALRKAAATGLKQVTVAELGAALTGASGLTFALFKEVQAGGTGGGNATTGAWTTRTLNTESFNNISGASLSSSVVTIPAGTYAVYGSQAFYRTSYTQLRVRDTTNSVDLATSLVAFILDDPDGHGIPLPLVGIFTVAGTVDVEFQYYAVSNENTNSLGLSVAALSGEYAQLMLMKIA